MSEIYGVFLPNNQTNYSIDVDSNKSKKLYQGIIGENGNSGTDNFFISKDGLTFCFNGVILDQNIKSNVDFFKEYQRSSIDFIKNLKGNFSGFVVDELRQKIFIFNDHLSTRNIFYFYDNRVGFVFSSKLATISKLLRKVGVPISLNHDAVYMMSLYGFLLENHTYINEVMKLPYSSIVTYDYINNEVNIEQHFKYTIEKLNVNIEEATKEINKLFLESVKASWSKSPNSQLLAFLSGGMDAKTNILVAKELGYTNIRTITFGASKSTDVKYAKQIAIKENFDHFERTLDYPGYLIDDIMENYIKPIDGLMMFHSSAHASSTVRAMNLSKYSILHTGQLGDSLFGSFTKPKFDFKKNRGSIGYTGKVVDELLLDKIEMLPEFLNKYQHFNYDLFNIEQRQINATLYGDRAINPLIDCLSPFMDIDLIIFCLSLPDNYKINQAIYFEWLSKFHKNILEYPWEKIQMKPNKKYKINYGRFYKKYYNGAKKYFHLNYDSMNPYAVWIKKYPFILNTLNHIFNEEIESSYINQELREDLNQIFMQDIFEYRNKFAVVTALLALKLHFKD